MARSCSIADCRRPFYGRGSCKFHYMRWYRYGDPLTDRQPSVSDGERFWRMVDKNGPTVPGHPELGACWVFTGSTAVKGYGTFSNAGHSGRAHRFAYEITVGPVPAELPLDHLCHTYASECVGGAECRHRACVNPAHLEPVTTAENNRRGIHPESRKTQCPQGHPYDATNARVNERGHRRCRSCERDRNAVRSSARGQGREAGE